MKKKFTIDKFSGANLENDEIRLSLSESDFCVSEKVLIRVNNEIKRINYYPDADYSELKHKIAKRNNLNENQVYIANGSDEIIFSIIASFRARIKRVISIEKSFAGYKNSAVFMEIDFIEIPIDVTVKQIKKMDIYQGDLFMIPNPHNPLGKIWSEEYIGQLAEIIKEKGAFLVLDEAYIEFGNVGSEQLLKEYNNLFIIRTFSKAYGLAGLRCGYVMSNCTNIEIIHSIRNLLPYNVNRFAYVAACEAIDDEETLKKNVKHTIDNREWFESELTRLNVTYYKSNANFVSIVINNSIDFVNKLYKEKKILLKELSGLGYENHIRIGIGHKKHLEDVLMSLKQHIENNE